MKFFFTILFSLFLFSVSQGQNKLSISPIPLEKIAPFINSLHYKPSTLKVEIDSLQILNSISAEEFGYLENIISYAKVFLGVRYRYAGYSAYGFDCSGFTSYVFSKFGYSLSRSAGGQAIAGKSIPKEMARKGDLIFFKSRNIYSSHIGHVGLVVSNENGRLTFIHASVYRGISFETLETSSYYRPRFIKICRIVE